MITSYRSMAHKFHPDNNYGFNTSEMMTMIKMAKEGFQDQEHVNSSDTDPLQYRQKITEIL